MTMKTPKQTLAVPVQAVSHSHALHTQRVHENETAVFLDEVDAVVYRSTVRGKWVARAFVGRATLPCWHYQFKSEEDVTRNTERLRAHLVGVRTEKRARAAQRSAYLHTLTVGDVLYSCWGYDQTNIDFYQVTRLVGSKFVEARKIAPDVTYTGNGIGRAVPRKDAFTEDAKRYRVSEGNHIKVLGTISASPLESKTIDGVTVYVSRQFSRDW
jgi:hypothetical protein